jgi:hypothetical protein
MWPIAGGQLALEVIKKSLLLRLHKFDKKA